MAVRSYTKDCKSLTLLCYPYNEEKTLRLADLNALRHISIAVHDDHTNADETYPRVQLADQLSTMNVPLGKQLRGVALANYVVATGADSYMVVLSLAEIDPSFHPGQVIVADSKNGQPLDANSGPFRLVVAEDKRPARWVRNLISIELKSLNKHCPLGVFCS